MSKTLKFSISFNWHGELMVELFFMISGVIISYILQYEKEPKIFLKKRMLRIYPNYWRAYFFAMFCWIFFRVFFDTHVGVHGSWFVNLALLPFEYNGSGNMVLPPAWSLYYEIFFYLVVTFWLFYSSKSKYGIYFTGIFLAFLPKVFTLEGQFFADFIMGFALMEFYKSRKISEFLFFVLAYVARYINSELVANTLAVGSIILIAGLYLESKGKMFKNKLLLNIGNASYSIYLFHMPAVGIMIYLEKKFCVDDFSSYVFQIAAMIWIIKLSIWNYENFELKIAKKFKNYIYP